MNASYISLEFKGKYSLRLNKITSVGWKTSLYSNKCFISIVDIKWSK